MQKILIPILLLCSLAACNKGQSDNDPHFGKVTFNNLTGSADIEVATDKDTLVNNIQYYFDQQNFLTGMRKFSFSEHGTTLLDTSLRIYETGISAYTLFRQNENSSLRIWNAAFLGLDTITLPPPAYIKVRILNQSTGLPPTVDIHFVVSTWVIGDYRDVETGVFYNVSGGFTPYQEILVGYQSTGFPVLNYTIVMRNSADKAILSTNTLTMPQNRFAQLDKTVYIYYLTNTGTLGTLMSK